MSMGLYGVEVEEAIVREYVKDTNGLLDRVIEITHEVTPIVPHVTGSRPVQSPFSMETK